MRLLVLIPSRAHGGAEEYAVTVSYTAVVDRKWHVCAAFAHGKGMQGLINKFENSGVVCIPANIGETVPSRYNSLVMLSYRMFLTLRIIRKVVPDAVLIVLPSIKTGLSLLLSCSLLRVPTVVTFQYVQRKRRLKGYLKSIYRWARSRNQQWVAVSDNNRRIIGKTFGMPNEKIALIPNGARMHPSSMNQKDRAVIRTRFCRSLGISPKAKLLLTVAALRRQKGYEYLIPVIPHIQKQYPNTHWLWVGEGPNRGRLVALLDQYQLTNSVSLLGHRDDIDDLLLACDLFIFPTLYEGQPFALLEAMTAGLPIVTTDASGIPEVIKHLEHGIVCKRKDSCDLLEAVRFALNEPEKMQQCAQNSLKRALDFSEEKMVRRTLHVITGMTANGEKVR